MKLLSHCPFCHEELHSSCELGSGTILWYCPNVTCMIVQTSRIYINTISNGMVRDISFMLERYKVSVYVFVKQCVIQQYCIDEPANSFAFITPVVRLIGRALIVPEAPDFNYSDMSAVARKIDTWVTLS